MTNSRQRCRTVSTANCALVGCGQPLDDQDDEVVEDLGH